MAASTPAWLTRRQAAALLAQSEAQVRAEDGKSLNPQKGPDGSWRYPPEEVAALLRGTSELSTVEPNGAVCAAAFELFAQKKALPDVVIEIKQPPSLVRCLRSEFDAMSRSLIVSDLGVATLEKLLRTPIQEEQQLVNVVTTWSSGCAVSTSAAIVTGQKRRTTSAKSWTRAPARSAHCDRKICQRSRAPQRCSGGAGRRDRLHADARPGLRKSLRPKGTQSTRRRKMITQGNSTHRIENWMTAQIYGPNRMPGGVVFTLRHAGLDEGSRLLRTWQVDTIPERDEFRDLVVEIDSAAQDDCEQLGWSTQRYLLMATSKQGKELGSLTLRYATSSLAEPGITADSEPASPRGQVAQAMRFAEASQRTLQAGMGFIVETLSRRLTAQDQLIAEQMRTQQSYTEQINAMADRGLERETMADTKKGAGARVHRTIAEIDHKHALFQFGIERVAPLIPLIGNRLFGKAPAKTAAAAHDRIASILGSLTPEQVAALQKVLTPEQWSASTSLRGHHEERKTGG